MAVTTPGPGRFVIEKSYNPDKQYAVFEDWFSRKDDGTVTFARRKANRPTHLKPGTPPDIKRQRMKLADCSKKWKNLTKEQKDYWKTICVHVIRSKHKGLTHTWQVKGRKAFISACLLGYVRSCDQYGSRPDNPQPGDPGWEDLLTPLMANFRIVDINRNPINKAVVKLTSKVLKEGVQDKVMYEQRTGTDGYPPPWPVTASFQPYDMHIIKTYESVKKTVNITEDATIDLIVC